MVTPGGIGLVTSSNFLFFLLQHKTPINKYLKYRQRTTQWTITGLFTRAVEFITWIHQRLNFTTVCGYVFKIGGGLHWLCLKESVNLRILNDITSYKQRQQRFFDLHSLTFLLQRYYLLKVALPCRCKAQRSHQHFRGKSVHVVVILDVRSTNVVCYASRSVVCITWRVMLLFQ